jgi:hypothetical protein
MAGAQYVPVHLLTSALSPNGNAYSWQVADGKLPELRRFVLAQRH